MFKYAIKNIFRYKTRSILTFIVIAVSAVATVFMMGYFNGMIGLFLKGFIDYETGHIRIVTEGFAEKERFTPVYENIPNVDQLKAEILEDDRVAKVVPAYKIFGLVGNGENTYPMSIVSFDFSDDFYELEDKIVEGELLETGLLMSKELQDKIGIYQGDSPILVSTTVDGGLNAVKPEIIGTTYFSMAMFDKHTVFVDLRTANKLLKTKNSATEVFVVLKKMKDIPEVTKELQAKYPNYDVSDYITQIGPLYSFIDFELRLLNGIVVFVMFLGSLIVVNSLVASIYERITEVGMLKVLGYSNLELTKMLFYEGLFFGVFAGGLGFLIGALLLYYLSIVGIDLTAMQSEGQSVPMETVLYPSLTLKLGVISFLVAVMIPALISLIPARVLSKIVPIDAINSRG